MVDGANDNVSDEELRKIEEAACPTCGCCSGMFTANSMNCLNEVLGFALPGNGTIMATHENRVKLFKKAAKILVDNAFRYYNNDDTSVLPRSIATKAAFMNSMALDIAMGGSTNTVLHLLAIAREAGVDFTMKDIDELSKKVPHICKVAPSCHYHVQDVNRAGGIMTILGELNRHGLLDTSAKRVDYPSLAQAISDYDIRGGKYTNEALEVFLSAPSMMKNNTMGYHNTMYTELDTDTANGCIRDFEHAYNKDGGLAVLYGNIAKNGCIVKTAGVDESLYTFSGPAIVFESQEDAVNGILGDKVKAGDVVIIRYEGPKGGPGMQEMLYPTSYIKSKGLGKKCALITDGRFSGGTSGLSIGHVSPEAANKGLIAVVKDGDIIDIDIPNRRINIRISDAELDARMAAEEKDKMAFKPKNRDRIVPASLKAYASMVSSADSGAVRIVE